MIKTLAVSSESLITKGGYAKQIQTKPELSEKHSFSLFYYHNVYSWYGNLALQNVIVMCNILGMIINVPHFLECAKPALDDIIEMDIRYDIDSCGIITRTKKNNGIVPWLRNILFHYRLHILLWCSHIVFLLIWTQLHIEMEAQHYFINIYVYEMCATPGRTRWLILCQ